MPEMKPKSQEEREPRVIYIKNELFTEIESGRKTLEVRVLFHSFSDVKACDIIEFRNSNNKSVRVKVNDIRKYSNLEDVLNKEQVDRIAPGFSKEEILSGSKKFFEEGSIKKYGLVVIDFEKI